MEYTAEFWRDELRRYKEDFTKFEEAGKKIVARYRDDRKQSENTQARFNILWSNVRTLKPAIYSKAPKIEISRRFKDRDDVSRVASMILERVISYEITQFNDYHFALSNCVEDRLLPGRGVAWVRYEPTTEQIEAPQITDDVEAGYEEAEPYEQITAEHTPVDYVFWQDFAHLPARTWEEVTWVARRVYMSQEEGKERFGDKFADVPLTHSPDKQDQDKSTTQSLKKAVVWEIWCKSSKKIYWVAEHFDEILDEKDDPLELEGFFPCPRPIFATITTDSLIPLADFKLYQDQADEIDEITGRIKHLTKALKVMGIYAADEQAIQRLFKEGQDATMIPVTNWPAFAEKGGLKGAMQLIPLGDIVGALQQLYQSREACKQVIYEVTGISDILRGASAASETATAQQIKSQFASIRLNDMKDDVARFARDLLRMKAEIICSKYQPELIAETSGIMHTQDAQFAPMAIELLRNEPLRNFMIDIQTDTLVELDEQAEKQGRVEFLTSASQFLEKATQVGSAVPELSPLLMQMLLFGVRGFKIGRDLEGEFERTAELLDNKQKQAQQQPPQPSPEMMQMQADQQAAQQKVQIDAQNKQLDLQADAQKHAMTLQNQSQIEQMRQEYETARNRERIAADLEIARMGTAVSAAEVAMSQNQIETGLEG